MIKNKSKIMSKTLSDSEESRFKFSSLLNFSLILTLITVCFYFLGFQYQTAFFQTYGVEVNTYSFSYESYFIAIGNEIISFVFVAGMIVSIFVMSAVMINAKPPKSARVLKWYFRKLDAHIKKSDHRWAIRIRKIKNRTKAFIKKHLAIRITVKSIKFSIYYLVLCLLCWTTVLIGGYAIFKITVSVIDFMSKNARTAALQQCEIKKAVKIELKLELRENTPLPANIYFFSYLGDKYMVFFDDNTDCSKFGNGSGFFVLNREDIKKITFSASASSN